MKVNFNLGSFSFDKVSNTAIPKSDTNILNHDEKVVIENLSIETELTIEEFASLMTLYGDIVKGLIAVGKEALAVKKERAKVESSAISDLNTKVDFLRDQFKKHMQ